jgi:hypothetical protein
MPVVYRVLRYEGTEEWLNKIHSADAIKDGETQVFRWNPVCQIRCHWLSDDEAQVLNVFSLFPILPPPAKPQP